MRSRPRAPSTRSCSRRSTPSSSASPRPTAPRGEVGGHPCQGIYWTPKGNRPRVALIAAHYNVDFAEHYLAPYIASRGYGFLGWNTRYRGAEDLFTLEHALVDIGAGVKWLRDQGAERVVILGNSGGGSLMGAYQAEATVPTLNAAMQGAAREALSSLPKTDLYISLNAHSGRPEVLTNWLDPSVTDELDPLATDQSLNPYNKENGPPYSDAFITRYRAAQRARNQRITDWCKAELKRLNAAGVPDRLFALFRAWADLRFMDGRIDPSDRVDARLLSRRSGGREPRLRARPRQHAAQLALDVEPGDLEVPGAGAAREVHDPGAGDPEPRRPGRVPERRAQNVRGGRLEGQVDRADPGQPLSRGRPGIAPPRGVDHRRLGEGAS